MRSAPDGGSNERSESVVAMKLGGLGAFVRSSLEASAAAASRRARSVAEPKRRLDLSDAVSLVVSLGAGVGRVRATPHADGGPGTWK